MPMIMGDHFEYVVDQHSFPLLSQLSAGLDITEEQN